MPNPLNVCIIMVHYGDVETTTRCLDSIALNLSRQPYVFISNNGPKPDAEHLRRHLTSIPVGIRAMVHQNDDNLGFATACNVGIRHAKSSGFSHIWLLNNDTTVAPGSLDALLSESERHPRSILGSTVVRFDAPDIIQVAGGAHYNAWTTMLRPIHAGRAVAEICSLPDEPMDYIYGASLFAPLSILDAAGYLDEDFFLYYEELDLCRKAVALDYSLRWCRNSIVRHMEGAATGSRLKTPSPTAIYHEARSTLLFTKKHHSARIIPITIWRILGKTFVLSFRGQWKLILPMLRGILSIINNK